MLLVAGPLLMAIALTGWFWGCCILAVVMALLLGTHLYVLPDTEEEQRPIRALWTALLQWRVLGLCSLCLCAFFVFQSPTSRTIWGHFVERITKTLPIVGQLSLEG